MSTLTPAQEYAEDYLHEHCSDHDGSPLGEISAMQINDESWLAATDGHHCVMIRGDDTAHHKSGAAMIDVMRTHHAQPGGVPTLLRELRSWCLDQPWAGRGRYGSIGEAQFDRELVAKALWPARSKSDDTVIVSVHPAVNKKKTGHVLRIRGLWWVSIVMSLRPGTETTGAQLDLAVSS